MVPFRICCLLALSLCCFVFRYCFKVVVICLLNCGFVGIHALVCLFIVVLFMLVLRVC